VADAPKPNRTTLEVEGRTYLVWSRPAAADPKRSEVSFDGETFHEKGADAYLAAKRAGKLLEAGAGVEVAGLPEDAAVAMLELVRLISSLRPGEELRVFHNGTALTVVKNKLVASFRPSVFEDAGFKGGEDEEG
jgi:hypothetical protein